MAIPAGFSTINPFIICRDVERLVLFLTEVFDGVEHPEARTVDQDGLLLHAELQIGGTTVMFGERKPAWPFTPALLQVYVDDVESAVARARAAGAAVVTEPTPFFGEVLARFIDPASNLWWVYSTPEAPADADERDAGWEESSADDDSWEPTPELEYIHDTLVDALARLRDPVR